MPTKILVADDSVTMRRILEMTFAGGDAEVVTVDSGEAAVARAAQMRPDLVLADLSLRGADGYEVARALKQDPGLSHIAVIVLSSQKNPYNDAKGSAAGVDDNIVKPFDTQQVLDRVAQVLARPRATIAASQPRVAAPSAAVAAAVAATVAVTPPAAAAPQRPATSRTATLAFGMPNAPGGPMVPAAAATPPATTPPAAGTRQQAARATSSTSTASAQSAPTAQSAASAPAATAIPQPVVAAAVATSSGGDLAGKLRGLGLTTTQVDGVLALSREVIERVVWEVVPDLAETIIREEIKRLTA